ncbi:MAG: non-ribosomal peptide synthetase [Chloroflexi bacterium]|nr:non-ribosomal peptide synthetase [Chloroflexota bacterium]
MSRYPHTVSDVLPPDQTAVRARCFHPRGDFVEFTMEETEQSIPERFEKQVLRHPQRLAVKTPTQELTYDRLNKDANRIASAILEQRAKGAEPIGLLFEEGTQVISAILGVLKSGKFYVPLDPSYPRARTGYMLDDSRAPLILTNKQNLHMAQELAKDRLQVIDIEELDSGLPAEHIGVLKSPDHLAGILYTSGSTGQPKGVVQTHRNVLLNLMNYANSFHICAEDRLTLLHSSSFSAGMQDIFLSLLNGASVHPFDVKQEGMENLANWLIQEQVTIYHSPPTLFRELVGALTGDEQFPMVRLVHLGSESVSRRDFELYKKHFSDGSIFVNRLGSSEALTYRMYFADHRTQLTGHNVPVGYGIGSKEVLLLDDNGEEVGFDQVGEIAVKSRYLSPGYWRRPDQTHARFLRDSGGEGEGVYLTGDLGVMQADGCLVHLGRKDLQVKIRGYRIEVAEIEAALMEHGEIREAVVVSRPDARGEERLVAYVVPEQDGAPDVTALRRFLLTKLPDYMVPSALVTLDALPLTPTGKVDRQALPEPDGKRPQFDTPYVAPRSPVEQALAGIWADLLGLDRVGALDDFFDLGGDSLLGARLFARIEKEMGARLPLSTLFNSPSVAQLASVLSGNGPLPGPDQRGRIREAG